MIPLDLRGRAVALAFGGAVALGGAAILGGEAAALTPGEAGPVAARALLVALALGAAVVLLRRRGAELPPPRLRVVSRAALARESSVVLVELDGRPLLLGVGREGVRLLSGDGWIGPEEAP